MLYSVRKAIIDDLPILLDFEQGIIEAERPFDPTLINGHFHYYDLKAMIELDEAEVLVAVYNDEVIASGYAIIKEANSYFAFGKYAYLGFMYVTPMHRGKGVNAMIIEGLMAWAHHQGLQEIKLQVYEDNESAVKAYEKIGFKKHLTEMRLIQ